MFTVSAMALLLRTVGPDQRGRATGAYHAGFLFGGVAGPALGGVVIGISIRAPFLLYAVTLGAATVVCLVWLKDPAPHVDPDGPNTATDAVAKDDAATGAATDAAADPRGAEPLPLTTALRDRAYLAAIATNLGNGFSIFGLRSALVPLFVVEGMRQGPTLAGIGFLVAALVQAVLLLPAGRMADNTGRRPAMIIGSAASVLAMVALSLGTQVWLFMLAMVVFGVSGAFLSPAPAAVVGDVTHGRPGGTVVAAFQMVSDFGAIVGPLAAGLMLDKAGFGAAFAVGGAIMGLGLVASLAMPETLRRRTPA
jgi:MFS family permease